MADSFLIQKLQTAAEDGRIRKILFKDGKFLEVKLTSFSNGIFTADAGGRELEFTAEEVSTIIEEIPKTSFPAAAAAEIKKVYSVSEITRCIKSALKEPAFQNIWIRGEVAEAKLPPSGHLYFTLKDENAVLKCVLWRSDQVLLKFRLEVGLKVEVFGGLDLYDKTGQHQLTARRITPEGAGEMQLALEQLRRKLEAEGLFDSQRKKPLPPFPRKVAVITSPTGAVWHDILKTTRKLYPNQKLLLLPSLVQGDAAPASICDMIRKAPSIAEVDLILIARGGGSADDLMAFNDERVVRAVAACPLAVISAVGHETDTSFCDFAADLRCATPTAAAEVISRPWLDLLERLKSSERRAGMSLEGRIGRIRERLRNAEPARLLVFLKEIWQERTQRHDESMLTIERLIKQQLKDSRQNLMRLASTLDALSPLKVLSRGYSVVYRGNQIITDGGQLQSGDLIDLQFAKNRRQAEVK